jgi:hypothetical protein
LLRRIPVGPYSRANFLEAFGALLLHPGAFFRGRLLQHFDAAGEKIAALQRILFRLLKGRRDTHTPRHLEQEATKSAFRFLKTACGEQCGTAGRVGFAGGIQQ